MMHLPVRLALVTPLWPEDSRGHLALLDDLCSGIICTVRGERGVPRFQLEVECQGRAERTVGHHRIGPGLVKELGGLLEARLGRAIRPAIQPAWRSESWQTHPRTVVAFQIRTCRRTRCCQPFRWTTVGA
ncbi:hypothetical protein [Deinococcus sp.]|uniref:hypothetical protein n=1 Tax=Deinococcus sp. TaxID=47478 RepID=UPI002869EBB0|nr:hypothetical protein [Deinococcus sp.]